MRIAINGFGRIGRSIFRILNPLEGIEVVAINDLAKNDALAYLLKHDTVMGPFPDVIEVKGDTLQTGYQVVKMTAFADPAELPWRELGVDYVVEATGIFRKRAEIARHLESGAKKVILTVPSKDDIDCTVVLGVNDGDLKPEHRIVSNASCTTNCLAPVAKVLHENFGIVSGVMTTVHAYTNDQRLADVPHSDWRRSRAAAENIIPTTTGAAKAVGKVLPALAGKLDGMAMRVPIPDGSIVDLVTTLAKDTSAQQINDAIRDAASGEAMKAILLYSEAPIVSSDIVGDPHSCIFDAPFTKVVNGNFSKTLSWYDNEWGYSNRLRDLAILVAKKGL